MAGLSNNSLFSDDDDDLLPSAGSGKNKLGSLFGAPQASPKGNDTLQYNRPKQPKKEDDKPKKSAEPALPPVLTALAVHLHKLEGSKWTPVGKVGCAVAESKTTTKYQLTFYQSKTSVICQVPINAAFTVTPQFSNNEYFGNVYDSKNQNWSFKFDSLADAETLAANIVLAKFYDAKGADLISQDVFVPPKGPSVADGDTLGVRYAAHNLQSGTLNKYEENTEAAQPKRVVLGSKKSTAGWEDALRGMKRTQRTVVLVPAGYGGETETKVYKFFLDKVKRNENGPAETATPPVPTSDGADLDLPVDSSKAAIMQRMKKMGAVALPGQGDSGDDVTVADADVPAPATPAPAPVPAPAPASPVQAAPQPQHMPQQPYMQPGMQPGMYHMGYGQPGIPSMPQLSYSPALASLPGLHMQPSNQLALISPQQFNQPYLLQQQPTVIEAPKPAAAATPAPEESKSMSPETIKLMVEEHQFKSNIQTKLDGLNTRVDEVLTRMEGTIFTKNKDVGPGVSAKALLQTIQRVVTENEKFTIELEARNQKIDALTEKLNKFHETNQRVIEENNRFMEERSVNLKNATEQTMKQLEQYREEKAQLEQELNTCERKFQTLKRAYTNLSTEMEQYKDQTEKSKTTADTVTAKFGTLESQLVDSEAKLREEQLNFKKLQGEFTALQTELADERDLSGKLRKTLEDNKGRYIAELQRREAAYDEERTTLETALGGLREVLARERAKSGTVQETLEKEFEEKWQQKVKLALDTQRKDIESRHQQALEAQQVNLDAEWRKRLEDQRKEFRVVDDLKEQVQGLTSQVQTYVQREEVAKQHVLSLQQQNKQLSARLAAAAAGGSTGGGSSAETAFLRQRLVEVKQASKDNLTTTVKSIMNNVYTTLNSQFDEETAYGKADILGAVRQIIVQTTVNLISKQQEEDIEEEPEFVEPAPSAPAAASPAPAEAPKPKEEKPKAPEPAAPVDAAPVEAPKPKEEEKPATAPAAVEKKTPPKPKNPTKFFDDGSDDEAPAPTPKAEEKPAPTAAPVVVAPAPEVARSPSPAPVKTSSPAPARKSLFFDDDDEPATLFDKPSTPTPTVTKKKALFFDEEDAPAADPLAPVEDPLADPLATPVISKAPEPELAPVANPLAASTSEIKAEEPAFNPLAEEPKPEEPAFNPLAEAPKPEPEEPAFNPLADEPVVANPLSFEEPKVEEPVFNPLAAEPKAEEPVTTNPLSASTSEIKADDQLFGADPLASAGEDSKPADEPDEKSEPLDFNADLKAAAEAQAKADEEEPVAEEPKEPEPITTSTTLEVPITRVDTVETETLTRESSTNAVSTPESGAVSEAPVEAAEKPQEEVKAEEPAAKPEAEAEKWDDNKEEANGDANGTSEASPSFPPATAEPEAPSTTDFAKEAASLFEVKDDEDVSAPPRNLPDFDAIPAPAPAKKTFSSDIFGDPMGAATAEEPVAAVPTKKTFSSDIFGDPLGQPADEPAPVAAEPAPQQPPANDLFDFVAEPKPSTPTPKASSGFFDDGDFPIAPKTSTPTSTSKKVSLDSIFGGDDLIPSKSNTSSPATKRGAAKLFDDDEDDSKTSLFD